MNSCLKVNERDLIQQVSFAELVVCEWRMIVGGVSLNKMQTRLLMKNKINPSLHRFHAVLTFSGNLMQSYCCTRKQNEDMWNRSYNFTHT
jgi:ubiquinone biosynthesis protein COQ9